MKLSEIVLNGKIFQTFEGTIAPNSNLVFIKGSKGFIMCGYLNMDTAEKQGNIAAIATGIKTVEDMLKTEIVKVTKEAEKVGICIGMPVTEALEKIY